MMPRRGPGLYDSTFTKPRLYDGALLPEEREHLFYSRTQRQRTNFMSACLCTLIPWFMFLANYAATSFSIRYTNPLQMYGLCAGLLVMCFGIGWLAFGAVVQKWRRHAHEPTWFVFLFVTMVIGWSLGAVFGNINYETNMQPYYDYASLNAYSDVNPEKTTGEQIMDAGRVEFTNTSALDLRKAAGFKNSVTYCVAPITGAMGKAELESYDFWAVGLDCCSANDTDFRCGDYLNEKAKSGLRLLRDDQRAFFSLAVQQAEAAHQIKAKHALFFYWGTDATGEMAWFREEGFRWYLIGMVVHFGWQLFAVLLAAHGFSKLTF